MNPIMIQVVSGTVMTRCERIRPKRVLVSPTWRKITYIGISAPKYGTIRTTSSQVASRVWR